MLFWDWNTNFDADPLNSIWENGQIPIITLEPWRANAKDGISLDEIAAGKEDMVLKRLGAALSIFGQTAFIRFGHEMNSDWYPWAGSVNERLGHKYIEAYRHFHDLVVESSKPARLIWVLSVNVDDVPNRAWNRPSAYYPGDAYVDALGIDGYSWFSPLAKSRFGALGRALRLLSDWASSRIWTFDMIYKNQIEFLRSRYPNKRLIISEVATGLEGSARGKWIGDFFESLHAHYQFVPLFVWFNVSKETDWRVENGEEGLDAFRKGVAKGWAEDERDALIDYFTARH